MNTIIHISFSGMFHKFWISNNLIAYGFKLITEIRDDSARNFMNTFPIRISTLFQYFIYILAKFNTFPKYWKSISQFNTFSVLSTPHGHPDTTQPNVSNIKATSIAQSLLHRSTCTMNLCVWILFSKGLLCITTGGIQQFVQHTSKCFQTSRLITSESVWKCYHFRKWGTLRSLHEGTLSGED